MARIEVEADAIAKLRTPAIRQQVLGQFLEAGFDTVTVDPRGYRQGALNEDLLALDGTHHSGSVPAIAL
ncbi:MAG TPA: hypothetical protein EYQ27_10410 [Gemmatimonadetes bacterium]|nr:hypothetical protein [Gemmatimonadota bacterium]